MKKPKKTGWVWWVVGDSYGWRGGKICLGPFPTRKEAVNVAAWKDKIIRKAIGQGKPEGYED